MFICNLKVDGNKLGKIFLGILFVVILIITAVVCYRILGDNFFKTNDSVKTDEVQELNVNNYTNVLKAVHDNIDEYTGTKINFTGYVYRVLDLKENQFILARDMLISSDFQSVIVGFLCECDTAKDFENGSWVEVTGEIYKGDYHGAMPIVKVTAINKTNKPNDEYVYPPDESYIPTSGIF